MRHSLRPALSLCQKNLYMLLHCPIGGTPDGCISASSYIKDRDWTRLPLSISFLLVIGPTLFPTFPFCSRLVASSFEQFPFADDWAHLPSSNSLLLIIERAFLRASPICSQLDASSLEHFLFARNW